jgi:hypothetical protein
MGKKVILILGLGLLFISCGKTSVDHEELTPLKKQMVGAPYETELDNRAKDALAFIRSSEKNLGVVSRYRRQIVKGINHYFEFSKKGTPPMEITVYEDLDGNFTITSKGVLE